MPDMRSEEKVTTENLAESGYRLKIGRDIIHVVSRSEEHTSELQSP